MNLNIKYDEIIARADQRRSNLKRLEASLDNLPAQLHSLADIIEYVDDLRTIWTDLDKEGRDLIPQPVREQLQYIRNFSESLNNAFGTDEIGLGALNAVLNKED